MISLGPTIDGRWGPGLTRSALKQSAAPGGFELAGRDGRFKPAAAEIKDGSVLVTSPDIPRPAYIRYGWSLAHQASLRNKEGLPAMPFRTDNIPLEKPEK